MKGKSGRMTIFTNSDQARDARHEDKIKRSSVKERRLCQRLSAGKHAMADSGYASELQKTQLRNLAVKCGEAPEEIDDFLDRIVTDETPQGRADRAHDVFALTTPSR